MRNWNWKYISLWIVIGIQFLMILGVSGAHSGTNIGPYTKICDQPGVYNNQTGFDQTEYYPCTSDIP